MRQRRWLRTSSALFAREPRPLPDPGASRHIPELREDPAHQEWGGMLDIIEHSRHVDSIREAETDGFFFDDTLAPGESDCEADPFSNGFLTEDEISFGPGYTPRDYVPDTVKQRIYFLYKEKGWDVMRLARKFGLRSERVSAVINMKETEPALIADGCYRDEVDNLMTQLYSGKHEYRDDEPSKDVGIHVALLKDDQLPEDVVPVSPEARRGRVIRLQRPTPPIALPPKEDRAFASRYAVKDISEVKYKKGKCLVVDFDGTARASTDTEDLYRSWNPKHQVVSPIISKSK